MENFDYVNDNRFADNDNMSGMETRPTSKVNSLIGEPSISRAPVVHHLHHRATVPPTPTRAAGAMPMSIRILLFLLFFVALRLCAMQNLSSCPSRLCAMQNLFGSSTNHEAVHQACPA
ncbi:MAG TPA: hypothetical protein ENN79_14570 [Desulfobacteraceae bacterium]|nr:hypothetical protein [Desulfobacteraceae bacterium]